MFLPVVALGLMLFTIIVKWVTTTALQQKQTELSEAAEENGRARHRLKLAVSEVNISEREIDKQKRKIKSSERRVAQLTTDLQALQQELEQATALNNEKLRLAQELKKRKGIG